MSGLINTILENAYIDKAIGEKINISTKEIIISDDIVSNLGDYLDRVDFGYTQVIVCDENTEHHYVKKLEKIYKKSIVISFPDGVKPDLFIIDKLSKRLKCVDMCIGVGSGTVNDICKYASYLAGVNYSIFATAPSMNGYLSSNASVSEYGIKKSVKAHLPQYVFCDVGLLAGAPKRLIKSGIGDSLCRDTVRADWLLSSEIFATCYNEEVMQWLKICEDKLLNVVCDAVEGDKQAISILMEALVVSGLAMHLCGGSYPASQGEHMIAHMMEMVAREGVNSFHGEQIAVTSPIMAVIQDYIIEQTYTNFGEFEKAVAPHLIPSASVLEDSMMQKYFSAEQISEFNKSYLSKLYTGQQKDEFLQEAYTKWSAIMEKISQNKLGRGKLLGIMRKAQIPTEAADIGWDIKKIKEILPITKYSRDRFTFLDLVDAKLVSRLVPNC